MDQAAGEGQLAVKLGRILREVRIRSGLSQRVLALRMAARGRGYRSVLCRLELGKIERPSVVLIADYLRACRAKFADIAEVLEDYVRQVPQAAKAAPEPVKPKRGERGSAVGERVERARRLIARRFRRRQLEEALYGVISAEKAKKLTSGELAAFCEFGRRRFGILERTRAKPERRQRQLEKEARRVQEFSLPGDLTQVIADAVDALFAEMERSGALDRLPDTRDFRPETKELRLGPVMRAEKRLEEEKRRRMQVQVRRRAAACALVKTDIAAEMEFERLGQRQRAWLLALIEEMFDIALRFDSEPEERDRRLRRLVAGSPRPGAARDLLRRFRAAFARRRALVPGRGGG
uniref:Uncharacterized protein n=1 Tax=candidate division WOR-3 bacterium TaxID=2052148 RepID=A0A7C4CCR9_UNCW3